MRTSPNECTELGRILAEKVNAYTGPVAVLFPFKAISIISARGGVFYNPAANAALLTSLKRHLDPRIPFIEMHCEINDPAFAKACANTLLEMLQKN
jgi:uncharacterized protein (UPF0261 family)